MARKKKQESGGGGAPAWLATYGDMVTLVLCFFVLLYSFSTLDAKKWDAVAASMQNAFSLQSGGGGAGSGVNSMIGGSLNENQGNADHPTDSDQMYSSNRVLALVQKALTDELNGEEVSVFVSERGVVVALSEQMLFEEGSAKLRPEALRTLYKIGGVLEKLPNDISVEGHTDSGVPLRSIYIDNWGLSSARASRVTAYLDETAGLPQNRLRAVGMGASAPIVPNISEGNMKLNRRVDIVILSMHPVR
ncbi:MAG: OmpA family protein [Synergistaceae bacterium]|jgi:chemotaxis protein MotB|nr:OmpA family protein [Synergistaceae bacterium]